MIFQLKMVMILWVKGSVSQLSERVTLPDFPFSESFLAENVTTLSPTIPHLSFQIFMRKLYIPYLFLPNTCRNRHQESIFNWCLETPKLCWEFIFLNSFACISHLKINKIATKSFAWIIGSCQQLFLSVIINFLISGKSDIWFDKKHRTSVKDLFIIITMILGVTTTTRADYVTNLFQFISPERDLMWPCFG